MLYHLSLYLKNYYFYFNVFHYVTFRIIASLLTSLGMSLLGGKLFIKKVGNIFKSQARGWTPASHKNKKDIPTMGGLYILAIILLNIFIWCKLNNSQIWIVILCLISFGAIGSYDDWFKIKYKKGISAKRKFILQWLTAFAVIITWFLLAHPSTYISFPFLKNLNPDLGLFFIPWSMFIIVATSNAVNLTDGLDGLAISSLISNFTVFLIICYLAGHKTLSVYLHIPFAGTSELSVIGAIFIGSALGFLWYNSHPAEIFMGDTGSLSLGASLGLIALMSKQELLLLISGCLFVIETLSVIMQVTSFKFFKKRLFRMTPIHHHFELIGWPESKITVRFGILSVILALITLLTLKIR